MGGRNKGVAPGLTKKLKRLRSDAANSVASAELALDQARAHERRIAAAIADSDLGPLVSQPLLEVDSLRRLGAHITADHLEAIMAADDGHRSRDLVSSLVAERATVDPAGAKVLVRLILSSTQWNGQIRLKCLTAASDTVVKMVIDEACTDPVTAVQVGMFLSQRDVFGRDKMTDISKRLARAATRYQFRLGQTFERGTYDGELDQELAALLATLEPADVAVKLAEQMPAARPYARDMAARLLKLDIAVQGVTAAAEREG